jgi:hypothetical protein
MTKQTQKKKVTKRSVKSKADARTLNQGQGPDFQTQDPTVSKKNKALKEQPSTTLDDSNEQDFPSKEREEIPYVGDNPDETERQSPKL